MAQKDRHGLSKKGIVVRRREDQGRKSRSGLQHTLNSRQRVPRRGEEHQAQSADRGIKRQLRAGKFFSGAALICVLGLVAFANVAGAGSAVVGVFSALGVAAAVAGLVAGFWKWRRERLVGQMKHLVELMTAGKS